MRQWGRGRMAAEGVLAIFSPSRKLMRQWGRGRMAAEGRMASRISMSAFCVNGAAAGWPRKAVEIAGIVNARV